MLQMVWRGIRLGMGLCSEATVDTFSGVTTLKEVCERVSICRRFICMQLRIDCCILRRTPRWFLHAGKLKAPLTVRPPEKKREQFENIETTFWNRNRE